MKILHLITRLILGGAQENTVLSCEGQAAHGHDVTLAFGPIYGPEGSLLQRAQRGGYALAELPSMIRAVRPLTDRRCFQECRDLIRRLKPDVVHTHSSKAGIVGRAAAWAEQVPAVVHTVHGLPYHPYQSKLVHTGYVWAERWAAKRCHKIVCVADAMSRQALAERVGEAEQYQTVYSGMEIGPFVDGPDDRAATRLKLGLAENDIVIGTVARLAELKGHDDLIDGLDDLLRTRPNVKLLWVGDGWHRKRLEQKIAERRLNGHVVITGLVDPGQIPAMMRAMDLLVHPSYREGLARTLPQALLSGISVVSYDCDGAGEVCIDGVTGRLVRTGDAAALAGAVEWMVDHPSERAAMASEGRSRCRRRFDAAVMVSELETLYERILSGRAST
ncbi:MAG: glycosyltransferase [Planctomycetes bacterium]|nr:glycosyltransferase [Planctomycetota bacterium]